jgi:chemotaxis protein methyltransferase WspC
MMTNEISRLLKAEIGLDSKTVGMSHIEAAVQSRINRHASETLGHADYLELLKTSKDELRLLIEEIIVPETWFFRDPGAFRALGQIAQMQPQPLYPQGFRVLCVACSSGEEPYSAAMALLDAGLDETRFHIDAIDVSARALEKARLGVYGSNSFRGTDLGFRDRYFTRSPNGYRINGAARSSITFQWQNLFSLEPRGPGDAYDAVFCRNLLIYFDQDTKHQAIQSLATVLKDDGKLFVAPAETSLPLHAGFAPCSFPLAFASEKKPTPEPASACAKEPIRRRPAPGSRRLWKTVHRRPPGPATTGAPFPAPPGRQVPDPEPESYPGTEKPLERARECANRGDLDQAATLCREHLQNNAASTEAFHLMGLIHDSKGEMEEAVQAYRKALYLDPKHYDSLMHLSYLMRKRGDVKSADTLALRAKRLENATSTPTPNRAS